MSRKSEKKREVLIETAAELVHRNGFHRTTLADIALEARIPLGNVYYYFKTKEAICEAIVDRYLEEFGAAVQEWEKLPSAADRLSAFIEMVEGNRKIAAKSGCPRGTLCAELHKEGGSLAKKATRLFDDPLKWIEAQFRSLGKGNESSILARHFLTAWQGSLLLAYVYHNPEYVSLETKRLREMVRDL